MHGGMRALMAALALLLVGACAPGEGNAQETGAEPPLGAVPTITSTDQVDLPIFSHYPSVDDVVALNRVLSRKVDACVGSHVITTVDDMERLTRSAYAHLRSDSYVYGFFDTSSYLTTGYGEAGDAVIQTFSDDAVGDKVWQCADAVEEEWGLDVDALVVSPDGALPDGGPPRPDGDSRYLAAAARWSACMKEQGFDYATPKDAQSAAFDYTSPMPERERMTLAKADVECKVSTNLVGVAVAVETAYQNRYIASHQLQLEQMRAAIEKALSS